MTGSTIGYVFVACDGEIIALKGTVSSPLYSEPYVRDGVCNWTTGTPQGTVISSMFSEFNLRYHEDLLEMGNVVTDGESDILQFRNNELPSGTYESTSNSKWLTLYSELTGRLEQEWCRFQFTFQGK